MLRRMADDTSRAGARYSSQAILDYANRVHAPHDDVLAKAFTVPEGIPAIQVGPSEGKLLRLLLRLLDEGRETEAQSARSKAFVTTHARGTGALCLEALGGNGIVLEYGVAKAFADAEAIYTIEGTRQMNNLIVGKAITGLSAFV